MNNERIQEIKEEWCRVEEMYKKHPEYRDVFDQAHPWIGYLLSEVERLQRENERLNNEMDSMMITLEDRSLYAAQKYWEYLLNEKEKLVETLEWYADDRNYKLGNQTILGEKARTAISHLKGE